MTIRLSTLAWIFVLAMAALGLYAVKFKVQSVHEEVETTMQMLEEEREALHVISAEWAYLARPQRLRQLAEKHLGMEPVAATQMVQLADLPTPSTETANATVPVAYNAIQPAAGGAANAR